MQPLWILALSVTMAAQGPAHDLLQTAGLIVRSALKLRESGGLHYTLDYPKTLASEVDTVLAS